VFRNSYDRGSLIRPFLVSDVVSQRYLIPKKMYPSAKETCAAPHQILTSNPKRVRYSSEEEVFRMLYVARAREMCSGGEVFRGLRGLVN
jgi:hypothetical protein